MNEMNFDWDDLRLFLAVARGGGLAAAAKETGKSPPTLGRRMLALENAVGLELFRRLPRGYELTDQGEAFLSRAADLEAQIAPFTAPPQTQGKTLVKISAGTWTTQVLCEKAGLFVEDVDDVVLRFISADHVLDIARREAVIGIRNRRPDQIGLARRMIGQVRFAGYAAGKAPLPWVRVMAKTPSALWLAANTDIAHCLEVTTPCSALDLAVAGVARAVLPTFIGDKYEGLARVTPLIDVLEHEQWLVTHHEERFVPEVRRTIDRVYAVLRGIHGRGG